MKIVTEEFKMKKWICPVCGYVHEGDTAPEFCPQCKVPGDKFTEASSGDITFATNSAAINSTAGDKNFTIGGVNETFCYCSYKVAARKNIVFPLRNVRK